jgi:hypothetical protein
VRAAFDGAVAAFHRRPLANQYKVRMLDGVVLARKTGAGALRRHVLMGLGLRHTLECFLVDSTARIGYKSYREDLRPGRLRRSGRCCSAARNPEG